MPQLGETVTEGTITRWLKQVGDHVDVDEPLFEVSTDKVDSEVPAPAAGVVTNILVPEGETVDVGTRLAVLGDAAAGVTAPLEPTVAPAVEQSAEQVDVAESRPAPMTSALAPPTPVVEPASQPDPVREPAPEAQPEVAGSEPPLTSPIVRRLVAERGLDARSIAGSGPGGRLTRKDVLDASAKLAARPEPMRAPPPETPAPGSAPAAPAPAAPALAPTPASLPPDSPSPLPARDDEVVPFDNIRRRTAEHMVRSKATSAHVYTSVEVDYERVERVRNAHQAAWKASEGFTLTYLPFIARAFCDVVREFPRVNASVGDDALIVHQNVNLSIAVDLDFNGLVAPVIRQAEGKRLRLIANEIHDLAARARSRKLVPDDLMGGTFTITNPGPYGTYATLAIINQPQVAILSTDGIKKRPVVVTGPDGDDTIAIHHTGLLVLTWDHRAFDGAYAAAFLRAMQRAIEEHNWEDEVD
jgi:2-oxoglutarate dehydrogenase E2 component (dihydrolipoamide succinyltransferase)